MSEHRAPPPSILRRMPRARHPPLHDALVQYTMATYVGPTVREGELVFGVAHIFASFNDTFVVRRGRA